MNRLLPAMIVALVVSLGSFGGLPASAGADTTLAEPVSYGPRLSGAERIDARAAPSPVPLGESVDYDPGPLDPITVARGSPTWALSYGNEATTGADRDIYFAKNSSTGMLTPTRVSGQVADELYPQIAYDPTGRLHIAFSMPGPANDLDVAHARSDDGGLTWNVIRLSITNRQHVTDIEISANGSIWIAYTDEVSDQVVGLLYSANAGNTWGSAGIQFSDSRIRFVKHTKLDSINNGSAGALFMSGLLQFMGTDALPVYYNDNNGWGAANWVINVFTGPLPQATGPWSDGSAGLSKSGANVLATIGYEIINGTGREVGSLFGVPWEATWSYVANPADRTMSANPATTSDSVGSVFIAYDRGATGARGLTMLFTDDNGVSWYIAPSVLPGVTSASNPAIDLSSTQIILSFFAEGLAPAGSVAYVAAGTSFLRKASDPGAVISPSSRGQSVAASGTRPVALAWEDSRVNDTIPPAIVHTPQSNAIENRTLPVSATITDNVAVASANLTYRGGGNSTFKVLPMTGVNGTYSAVIPAADVLVPSVEYHIQAIDTWNNTARNPSAGEHNVTVILADVSPPVIAHTPPGTAKEGTAVQVNATITDNVGVGPAYLEYRKKGDISFKNLTMTVSGSVHTALIPGADVLPPSMEYHINASDTSANWARSPNGSGEHEFNVTPLDRAPPTITHVPVTSASAGVSVSINATVTDNVAVANATLSHRRQGVPGFTDVAMTLSGGLYRATIPPAGVLPPAVEYHITAYDAEGNSARHPSGAGEHVMNVIVLDTQPPTITLTAPAKGTEGVAVKLDATVTDNVGVAKAELSYRTKGGTTFTSVGMTASGSTYSATVPAADVKTPALEFHVSALDAAGNAARNPTGAAEHEVPVDKAVVPDTDPPVIAPRAAADIEVGNPQTLKADVSDVSGVALVQLKIRAKGQTGWTTYDMTGATGNKNSDLYSATVAAGDLPVGMVDWYVTSGDTQNNQVDSPEMRFEVKSAPALLPPPAPSGPGGISLFLILAIVVLAAVVGGTLAFILLRRRKTPPPPVQTAPYPTAPPPNYPGPAYGNEPWNQPQPPYQQPTDPQTPTYPPPPPQG